MSVCRLADGEPIALTKSVLSSMSSSPFFHQDVLYATVIRMPKTYPVYFGTLRPFPELSIVVR